MSRLLDVSARNDVNGRSRPTAGAQPYVLIADADPARTDACLASVRTFQIGCLVARDGEEALGILQRMGPPVLLIADLSLPHPDGFAVIEALRDARPGRARAIAWSASRALREFAANRFAGMEVRILGGTVAPDVLSRVIGKALEGLDGRRADRPPEDRVPDDQRGERREERSEADEQERSADAVQRRAIELSDEARALCAVAGVAVYVRTHGTGRYRTSVTWMSDRPIPQPESWLPRVFASVVETGSAVIFPDVTTRLSTILPSPEGVRGLAAVPLVDDDERVAGALCVFDVKPLDLDDERLAALEALGRSRRPAASASPLRVDGPETRARGDVRAPSLKAVLGRGDGDAAVSREVARVRREQRALSVALFEVDAPGRYSADAERERVAERLAEMSASLCRAVRGSDLAVRWGGVEFLVVFPGLSQLAARRVAERVRAVLEAAARHDLTVSGGVAELVDEDQSFQTVVDRAIERLHLAQVRGPNRVA
jgi:diguanylate cyclase (GGDEF)-like protein